MRRYFRTHILCNTPLKGYYRYEDQFQLLPLETDALYSPYASHYPMYLEYSVDVESDITNENLSVVTLNKEKEIVRLLSVFNTFHFFYYTGRNEQWAAIAPALPYADLTLEQKKLYDSQISFWTCATVKTKYLAHEIEIDSLSQPQCKVVERGKDVETYFEFVNDDRITQTFWMSPPRIVLSLVLTPCLNAYYALSEKHRQIVRSSIYLACDGLDVKSAHKALGYLSIVSALEGLTKLLKEAYPTITSKGKLLYPRKEEVFCNMLKSYFSAADEDIEQYRELYRIRCDVTHDNAMFALDYGVILDETDMRPSEDWYKQIRIERLYRTVLTNMMLDTKRTEWIEESEI